jgi:diaminohydroxyphosphoribosylaminopyrimidine deaminase/5-amino-6-(5-phosphoribosylamino)uracil reductase
MRLRDQHDAVLVGIGTVLADDPKLTARLAGARDPVRVIVDSQLRTPPSAKLWPCGPRTIVACTSDAPADREAALIAHGAEVWRIAPDAAEAATIARPDAARVDLAVLARQLARAGVLSVLVEGGGAVHADLLARGLADELVIYVAPKIVGGPAKSWVGGDGLASLAAAYAFVFDAAPVALGGDFRITAHRP